MSRSFLQQRNINLVPVTNQSSIVWNTVGTSADVNTWEQLYSFLQRSEVPVNIYLEAEVGAPAFEIPAGTWNLHDSFFISKTSEVVPLIVRDGAVIQNLAGLYGIIFVFQNSAPVIIVEPDDRVLRVENSALVLSGSAEVISVPNAAASPFYLELIESTISTAVLTPLIALGGGAALAIQLMQGSQIVDTTVSGPVGSTLTFQHDGGTPFPIPTQTLMLGTVENSPFGVVGGSGPTTFRPASPTLGTMYFDTTLVPPIPIWWDGAQWVDATGTGPV